MQLFLSFYQDTAFKEREYMFKMNLFAMIESEIKLFIWRIAKGGIQIDTEGFKDKVYFTRNQMRNW